MLKHAVDIVQSVRSNRRSAARTQQRLHGAMVLPGTFLYITSCMFLVCKWPSWSFRDVSAPSASTYHIFSVIWSPRLLFGMHRQVHASLSLTAPLMALTVYYIVHLYALSHVVRTIQEQGTSVTCIFPVTVPLTPSLHKLYMPALTHAPRAISELRTLWHALYQPFYCGSP